VAGNTPTTESKPDLQDDVLYANESNYFGTDTLKLEDRRTMSMTALEADKID